MKNVCDGVMVSLVFSMAAFSHNALEIPVIDLLQGDEETIASEIRDACINTGFFFVSNHGVPDKCIESTFAASKAFFSLDKSTKMDYHAALNENNRGWNPLYEETLDPAN